MSDFSVEEWFEATLWPTYPRDLCNRIGSKSKALMSVRAKIKTEKEADSLMASLREQIRYYRKLKQSGAHGSEWTLGMLSTYLNGERWNDEIPSHSELKQNYTNKKCACGNDVDIKNVCWPCHCKLTGQEDWREKRIWEFYVKNNLGQQPYETKEIWRQRLMDTARKQYRQIG